MEAVVINPAVARIDKVMCTMRLVFPIFLFLNFQKSMNPKVEVATDRPTVVYPSALCVVLKPEEGLPLVLY